MPYNLVITGPVAVGKSTMCEIVKAELETKYNKKVIYIPEYLVKKEGPNMLKQYLNKCISNVTFQNYILDYYEETFSKGFSEYDIVLFERLPDDNLLCFANMSNKNNEFSDLDLLNYYNRVRLVNHKYQLPSYIEGNISLTSMLNEKDIDLSYIINIIMTDMKNNINNRVVLLSASLDTLMARVIHRGREGEENYSKDTLNVFRKHYAKLEKYLESKQNYKMRFVDLGQFI